MGYLTHRQSKNLACLAASGALPGYEQAKKFADACAMYGTDNVLAELEGCQAPGGGGATGTPPGDIGTIKWPWGDGTDVTPGDPGTNPPGGGGGTGSGTKTLKAKGCCQPVYAQIMAVAQATQPGTVDHEVSLNLAETFASECAQDSVNFPATNAIINTILTTPDDYTQGGLQVAQSAKVLIEGAKLAPSCT